MSEMLTVYNTDSGEVSLSEETVRKYLVNGNGNVSGQEVMMFLNLCKYQKLNPFLREAYLIKFNGPSPATIITGKEVFTKRASKNANCSGWRAGVVIINEINDLVYRDGTLVLSVEKLVGGWCEVARKDWSFPIRVEVSITEYQRTKSDGSLMSSWKTMPATMIRKVAIVQALRDAFPEDLQGLYSQEEMPIDNEKLDTTPIVVEVETEAPKIETMPKTEVPKASKKKEAAPKVAPEPLPIRQSPPIIQAQTTETVAEAITGTIVDIVNSLEMTVEQAKNTVLDAGNHCGKTCGDVYKNHYTYYLSYMKCGTNPVIRNAFEILDAEMKKFIAKKTVMLNQAAAEYNAKVAAEEDALREKELAEINGFEV